MPAALEIPPGDRANAELVSHVHPGDWTNPEPAERYNLVVLGAGTAGLVSAVVAAGLGARVALVERHLMGGDCLNTGCVPSKAIIRSGRAVADLREATRFGVSAGGEVAVDFPSVMKRMREVRARIAPHDSARRYRDELGVDVFLGEGRFTGPDRLEVGGATLRFARAVIASGGRAVAPPIPGLAEAGYLTNETLFELTECPRRLGVIGAGPIGCEMAQTFQRLGASVTLFEQADGVLPREDRDAAAILERRLAADGVALELGASIERILPGAGGHAVRVTRAGTTREVVVDALLVSSGRAPNVDGIGLELAGVAFDAKRGVHVDDRLRTTNKRIFAAGDCALEARFTHTADAAAKIVVRNAFFFGRQRVSDLVVPWCTYTDPEIAHVGLYPHEARARGHEVDTYRVPLAANDRSLAEGDEDGYVEVCVKRGSDRILGGTIVARHAGEMISELTLAIVGKLGLATFAGVIHPYPTQAEALKATSSAYMRTRLTPFVAGLFSRWLRFLRR